MAPHTGTGAALRVSGARGQSPAGVSAAPAVAVSYDTSDGCQHSSAARSRALDASVRRRTFRARPSACYSAAMPDRSRPA